MHTNQKTLIFVHPVNEKLIKNFLLRVLGLVIEKQFHLSCTKIIYGLVLGTTFIVIRTLNTDTRCSLFHVVHYDYELIPLVWEYLKSACAFNWMRLIGE